MDKANLHEGHAYAFRAIIVAWERAEDRSQRVILVRQLGVGKHPVRFDDGSEAEVRSEQLIEEWAAGRIERLLQAEER